MPDEKRAILDQAAAAAAAYVAGERTGRVAPTAEAIDALQAFADVSLDEPIAADAAIEMLATVGSPAAVRSTGGRYFGFVNGGVTPAGLGAAILAHAWDQNAALPVMSPVAAAIDAVAARWVVDVLGLPAGATAAFCAGATVANLTAIITARDDLLRRRGWDVAARGLVGAPPIDVVTSAETHISVLKVLRLAGIGMDAVHFVPTDTCGRLRPDQLPDSRGLTLAVLQAGNVNTGHSDPFAAVADRLDRDHSWIHVDGAFGLWANAAPDRRASVAGVDLADSWATDAHKWLNAPYDCGVIICADPSALERSMRQDAAYVESDHEQRASMHLGIQMSQAARAVPVWATLATLGRSGVADLVEHTCLAAERFAERLDHGGATVLAPVALNQVLVSFGTDEETDEVVATVQAEGEAWMGATTWQGRRAMRISVSDSSTTFDDVDRAADAVLDALAQVR